MSNITAARPVPRKMWKIAEIWTEKNRQTFHFHFLLTLLTAHWMGWGLTWVQSNYNCADDEHWCTLVQYEGYMSGLILLLIHINMKVKIFMTRKIKSNYLMFLDLSSIFDVINSLSSMNTLCYYATIQLHCFDLIRILPP